MAEWNEHVLKVTASMTQKSKQAMKNAIHDAFTEGSHVNFNNTENLASLRELAKFMEKTFRAAGNTKIDFSQMIELPGPELFDGLKNAAKEFESVWDTIVSKFGSSGLKDIFMQDASALSSAFDRISKDGQVIASRIKGIQKAFSKISIGDPEKILVKLQSTQDHYSSKDNINWETQYSDLLQYIHLYEKYVTNTDADVSEKVMKQISQIGPYTYQQLKEVEAQISASLQNIFNFGAKKPLTGLTEGGRVDVEVAPTVVTTLSVGDLVGQKGKGVIEVPVEFKANLKQLRDLYAKSEYDQAAWDEFEKLQQEMVKNLPKEIQEAAIARLGEFIDPEVLKNVTESSYKKIYKDFVGYGMPTGGSGSGIGPTPEDVENARQAIQQETNAISEQNEELKENANLKNQSSGAGVGQTDGDTTGEVENIEKVRAKVAEITTAVEAKTNAFKTEGTEVGNVVDGEITKLGELENKITAVKTTLEGLLNNIRTDADDVGTGLSNITVNVNHQKDEENKDISINKDSLKQTLGEVIYNVKIAHEDNDKQANKIVIDEPTNEPSAIEKVLSDVQEVLGKIQANTANIEPQQSINNVESALSAIKTATESVDKKIVRGTKTVIGGEDVDTKKKSKAVEGRDAQILAERIETQKLALKKFKTELITSSKMTDDVSKKIRALAISLGMVKDSKGLTRWGEKFKQEKLRAGIDVVENKDAVAANKNTEAEKVKLAKQYQELGVLQAQAEAKKTEEAKIRLTQLQQEITEKQKSLKLSEEELETLKQITEEAKADELDALGAKKSDKNEKKRLSDAKKLAKRQAMTGKASSAISRAEGTWLAAESLEQAELPTDFKKQVEEYYDALDKLRLKHHEINTSDVVTDEQQNELIAQTKAVNKLTEQISPLIAQYERLSGKNTAVLGPSGLGENAGLREYEQALRQAVMTATNGKAQIKGFNNETKTLTYTLKTGKNEFTEYTAEVRQLDHQLVATQGPMKKTETFLEATKRKMKELTSYMSGMAIFSRIGQELRRGIQYVREIDLALTELKKVTDETEESYDRFLETAAKTADKVGSTIQKVVSSTADWARLGYSMEQAAKFAETTQILMNVSEFTDVSQATDTLISAVQAFGYTAETSMDVVDLLNTIGKQNCRNYIVIYS